jgi:hypothetical protein
MQQFLSVFCVLFIIIFYSKTYFYFFREKVIFIKFLKGFIVYTIFVYYFFYLLNSNYFEIDNNFLQSLIVTYILFFLVIFFNISTKSYESPTVIIHNIIEKDGASFNEILIKLKKKKLVKVRIKDLIKQGIIFKKKNQVTNTSLGLKFSKFYNFLRKFFKIKCKG